MFLTKFPLNPIYCNIQLNQVKTPQIGAQVQQTSVHIHLPEFTL